MANSKITDYSELTTGNVAATSDFLEVVDVSDTSMAATGTNKKLKPASLVVGGFGGTSGRIVFETTGGALTDSANLTFSGSTMAFAGTSPTISTASTELILKQTGDTFGETGIKFQNRSGVNGALFYTAGIVNLVDFAFQTLNTPTSNFRVEGRSGSQIANGNSSGGNNEIEIIAASGSAPTVILAAGIGSVVFCPPAVPDGFGGFLNTAMTTPRVGIAELNPGALLQITCDGSSRIGQITKGASSQSGDLHQWQNSSATVLSRVKSTGEINGPIAFAYVAKTTTYTATAQDSFFAVSAASPWTLTLPAASGVAAGHIYVFKKTDNNANTITIARAGSDTIDGATSYTGLSAQYKYLRIVSDGSANWWNVGSN